MATETDPPAPHACAAGIMFAAVVAVAFPLYLIRGNEQWFFLDEWDFLASRRATRLHDLLAPHNEHWSTLPILAYRALWQIVGLRSYVPYQVGIVVLHLSAAILLWMLMRRARVQPFIAAAAAATFVLFGSGREDIVWAFQIGFVGALVCGLGHLLLADHDGPLARRDVLGLAVGGLGLMCSGVAVTMTIVVALAVVVRRGWRAAAFHAAPLAVVYLVWWVPYGRPATSEQSYSPGPIVRFVAIGVGNGFGKLGQLPGVGAALGVLLVVGLGFAWWRMPITELRRRAAAPSALLVGAFVFLTISAVGRAAGRGPESARASHYAHIVAALALPSIAVAADALARRWRFLTPVVIALFLVGVPGNIDAIQPRGANRFALGNASHLEALAHSPYASRVPRSSRPLGIAGPEVTVGWLLDGAASGRIPVPPRMTPSQEATISLVLALQQGRREPSASACTLLREPERRLLATGASVVFAEGILNVQLITEGGIVSDTVPYAAERGGRLTALTGPLHLRLSPPAPGGGVSICT